MISQKKYLDKSQLKFSFFSQAIAFSLPVKAQVIPDNTLGAESSVVTLSVPNRRGDLGRSSNSFLIEGGAIRESNLFHSFQEFNINRGQQVNFNNPDGIANIFSRVTGSNASQIFGKLGVNGNANLFLINPNGIIFGEGANINVNGSFLASTANSIIFGDGNSFSAVNPEAPLLTISIPVGLQLGNNPQAINARRGTINTENATLIGGYLNLERTTTKAPGGRIQLSSFADGGTINFGDIPTDIARGDIVRSDRYSQLMTQFYRYLSRSNVPKANAVRQAQSSLLQNQQYNHPYYWAAFVLVGHWQ